MAEEISGPAFLEMSERVERIRRNLLLFSSIGVSLYFFNIQFSEISYAGIKISGVNEIAVYIIIFACCLYETVILFIQYYTEAKVYYAINMHKFATSKVKMEHRVDPFLGGYPKDEDKTVIDAALSDYYKARKWTVRKAFIVDMLFPCALGVLCIALCGVKIWGGRVLGPHSWHEVPQNQVQQDLLSEKAGKCPGEAETSSLAPTEYVT